MHVFLLTKEVLCKLNIFCFLFLSELFLSPTVRAWGKEVLWFFCFSPSSHAVKRVEFQGDTQVSAWLYFCMFQPACPCTSSVQKCQSAWWSWGCPCLVWQWQCSRFLLLTVSLQELAWKKLLIALVHVIFSSLWYNVRKQPVFLFWSLPVCLSSLFNQVVEWF